MTERSTLDRENEGLNPSPDAKPIDWNYMPPCDWCCESLPIEVILSVYTLTQTSLVNIKSAPSDEIYTETHRFCSEICCKRYRAAMGL